MRSPTNLKTWAEQLLFGTRLEDKLQSLPSISLQDESHIDPALTVIPRFPGRPPELSRVGKADFPSVHQLHQDLERGKVLHFFANHELLALELMALVLLRFPDAPPSFRKGLAQIIQEEQGHLRLYLARMKELGVQFGDLPMSEYFWNSMKSTPSPLDFTLQMSLTFEQANLDFSFFYMNAMRSVGDSATAALLYRVFQEEMGHVKHGLVWFNRWRQNLPYPSDWDAYAALLPHPLNPQRAKGLSFCAEARREVGFSDTYIRELQAYSGSKGRPPQLWFYNPHCDSEIVRGKPGFHPSRAGQQVQDDLQNISTFLALNTDIVLTRQKPSLEWIESVQNVGFSTPEYLELKDPLAPSVRVQKIGGFQPWGWSPEMTELFSPLSDRLVTLEGGNRHFCERIVPEHRFHAKDLGKLFSKTWSTQFLHHWIQKHSSTTPFFGALTDVGQSFSELNPALAHIGELLAEGRRVMIKAPFGTSGMQVKTIEHTAELQETHPKWGWMRKILAQQGSLVVEPYLDKLMDLSIQIEIKSSEGEPAIRFLEVRRFYTGRNHEYRGTALGKKIPGLAPEAYRFFYSILPEWKKLLRRLGERLQQEGYEGPAGIDAFLWRHSDGSLRLKPLVELNPRWTMGRVALELERHLSPGVSGLWFFIPLQKIAGLGFNSKQEFVTEMHQRYPVVRDKTGIRSGALLTNDPSQASSVITVLVANPSHEIINIFESLVHDGSDRKSKFPADDRPTEQP
jgi:uncharacterized ferritin-like protein (DUF455 family)